MKSQFKIEKDVPMPEPGKSGGVRPGVGRKPKYPWSEMEVGNSFFVEGALLGTLGNLARKYGKVHGTWYIVRRAERRGREGVRVWRSK